MLTHIDKKRCKNFSIPNSRSKILIKSSTNENISNNPHILDEIRKSWKSEAWKNQRNGQKRLLEKLSFLSWIWRNQRMQTQLNTRPGQQGKCTN